MPSFTSPFKSLKRGKSVPKLKSFSKKKDAPVSSIKKSTSHTSLSDHSTRAARTRDIKDRDVHKYYDVMQVLGVGTMGSVCRVRKKTEAIGGSARTMEEKANQDTTDNKYEIIRAMKTIHLHRVTTSKMSYAIEELRNEIDILRRLDHPNIVKLFETYEYNNQICIIMELCNGGDLYARSPYTEAQAQRTVRKLTSAIAYMHRCGLMHRDLKFENIMYESKEPDAEVKLIDFGLAAAYNPEDMGGEELSDMIGTIYTIAPEVIEGAYDKQADVWSIGVIAFMLLSSSLPFFGKSRDDVEKKIIACDWTFKDKKRWKTISKEAKDFIRCCIVKDPETRLNAESALHHPWLDADFAKSQQSHVDSTMEKVKGSMERYANYSKLKKLALLVVAHKSTTKEIGSLLDAFERFDSQRDGTVNFDEFKKALQSAVYKTEMDSAEMERMFKSLDLDGSGTIHYTEFLAATIEAHGVIVEERLAEAFDRLDSDDSGFITKENLVEFLAGGLEGRDLTEQYVTDIIAECDTDNDGKICYQDFLNLWAQKHDEDRKYTLQSFRGSSMEGGGGANLSFRQKLSFRAVRE